MSNSIPLLTILGVLPLAFALIAFVVRGKAGKQLALVGSLVTLAVGVWAFFAAGSGDLSELVPWIPQIGAWSLRLKLHEASGKRDLRATPHLAFRCGVLRT